jgi:MbeD/MobD like protein
MTFEEWFAQQDFNVRYGNAVEELQKEYEARLRKAWQAGYEEGARNMVILQQALDALNAQLLGTTV